MTGPVFYEGGLESWIGERAKGEQLAAVPDALFKVVIKDSGDPQRPDVLGLSIRRKMQRIAADLIRTSAFW